MSNLNLTFKCIFCGREHKVAVNAKDYTRYRNGELAQHAFPYLNATQREQIISSMCPDCQDRVFGIDEDEEEEELEEV